MQEQREQPDVARALPVQYHMGSVIKLLLHVLPLNYVPA